MKRIGFLLSALFLGAALPAQALHVWVDGVNGSDTNKGTRTAPFKTLTKGFTTYTRNVVVHILPAVYGPKTTGDFWNAAKKAGKGIALRAVKNMKIVGEDRDKCIIDFNNVGNLRWGLIPITGGTDGLEVCNLTFKNVGNSPQPGCTIFQVQATPPPKNVNIHNNLFLDANVAFYLMRGINFAFHDNIVAYSKKIGTSKGGSLGSFGGKTRDNLYCYNNVFYNLKLGVAIASNGAKAWICNNIFYDCDTGLSGQNITPSITVVENNLFFKCTTVNVGPKLSKSNLITDPKLVNPAKFDFRQQAGSPCLDGGYPKALLYMENDFFGNARAADGDLDGNSLPDIGAQEIVQATLSVTNFAQGKTAVFQTQSLVSGGFGGIFFLGTKKTTLVISPFGFFGIDPLSIFMGTVTAIPGKVQIPVPNAPWAAGTPIYSQALGFRPKSGGGFVFMPTGLLTLYL